jgi:hypothetical protein
MAYSQDERLIGPSRHLRIGREIRRLQPFPGACRLRIANRTAGTAFEDLRAGEDHVSVPDGSARSWHAMTPSLKGICASIRYNDRPWLPT